MKEGEEGAPDTFVTPRRRKKRRGTDFSNRKARQRREARRKKGLVNNITGTPVKDHVGGFCFSSFSIRKLDLDSIVEREVEIVEEASFQRDKDHIGKIVPTPFEMTGGRRGRRKQIIVSPQPSISRRNSESMESEVEAFEEGQSDSVRNVTNPHLHFIKICYGSYCFVE